MGEATLVRGLALALLLAELGVLTGPAPIRLAAGLTLGLVLPGLVVARVTGRPWIGGAERLLLVPGLSVAVAIITGLGLNAAQIPLTAENWAIALGVITAAGVPIAARGERDEETIKDLELEPGSLASSVASSNRPAIPGVAFALMLAIAALGAAGALVISTEGEYYRGPGFTELWALPGPTPRAPVRFGVISHELHKVSYVVRISIGGRDIGSQQITLRPGQSWHSKQTVTGPGGRINVWLQKWPSGTLYRQVHVSSG